MSETEYENESYHTTYCEWCGELHDGPEAIVEAAEEPVERVGLIELVESLSDYEPVAETVATEESDCDCGGQIVKRYYVAGEYPDPEDELGEIPEEEFVGRDLTEDALIDMEDGRGLREVSEVSWLKDGGEPGDDTQVQREDEQ
jgi:hypothetical protein